MPVNCCTTCGTPLILGAKCAWPPDGSIRLNEDTSLRMFFADLEELTSLFRNLGSQLDIHGPSYLQEGARSFSRDYTGLLLGFLHSGRAGVPPDSDTLYTLLCDHLRVWGLGAPEIREHETGSSLKVELTNPADPDLICGYLRGGGELIEERGSACGCAPDSGGRLFEVIFGEAGVDVRCPHSEIDYGSVKGVIEYSCCPECGVPLQIARLSWDIEGGAISDVVTGRRLALLGTRVVSAALFSMAEEWGEHVYSRVVEMERDYARDVLFPVLHVSKDPHEMRALFGSLGHGDITAEGEGKVVFRVRHPFQPHFMAGRILGIYEGWRGERVAASWRVSEWGTAYVTVYN